MEFEKSDCIWTHTITSTNVLVDKDTRRVVAVFYNDYDLDHVIGSVNELVKQNAKLTDIIHYGLGEKDLEQDI